jgi:hypothetical protein
VKEEKKYGDIVVKYGSREPSGARIHSGVRRPEQKGDHHYLRELASN